MKENKMSEIFRTTLLADESLPEESFGNQMILSAELVPITNLQANPKIGIALNINTEEHTEVYFEMPLHKASEFSQELNRLVEDAMANETKKLKDALEFKSAQLSCAKGAVGVLQIDLVAPSERDTIGFNIFDLTYFDDSDDSLVLHHIEDIECYVPSTRDEQYEWLRALVGGNHAYSSSIKVNTVNFTLDSITQQFNDALNAIIR